MQIKSLELNNYRNYKSQKFLFDGGLNVLVGKNAQGKTNLLESVYYCSIAKSLRTTKDKDLINFGQDSAKIKLNFQKEFGESAIEIFLFKQQKKAIKINGTSILRVGDLLGQVLCVYFSPDEMRLIKDSPDYRRRFLDIAISQQNKSYFYSLLKYEKILNHRNKLLKDAKSLDAISDALEIFTEQLASEGAKIVFERVCFIKTLQEFTKKMHARLTDNKEEILVSYIGFGGESVDEIKQKLLKEFKKLKQKEFDQGHTLFGPHRDDLKIECNGIDIRQFGSQGQQRTATLSLKLAGLEILKEKFGENPILLLDDVLSELDAGRKKRLLEIAKNYQTFLACTEFDEKEKANIIKIKEGRIIK